MIMAFVATFTTSCTKEKTPGPSVASQLNGKTLPVESIKTGQVDFTRYVLMNYDYNASNPTMFQMKIDAGKSFLYKSDRTWEMENATLTETKTGMLDIRFIDPQPTWFGQLNYGVPMELVDKHILTSEWNGGSTAYTCSSEVLNGVYQVEKKNGRFILTRNEYPEIVITLLDQ